MGLFSAVLSIIKKSLIDNSKARLHAPNTYDDLKISHVKCLQLLQIANNERQHLIACGK